MVAGIAVSARASSPAAVGATATPRPASTLQAGSALRLAAQAAVSRVPTADHRPFRIHRTASGAIIVSDPARGLYATLIAGRIAIRNAHGLRVSLSGAAIGRGATLTPVRGFAAPALSENRVTFASPTADEWYAKSRTGIEQGFAISDRPAGRGPLKITQPLSGNAQAHSQAGGQDVRFGSDTAGLRYGQLVVSGAGGARMRASMSISGHHLTITINDAEAVYPLRVDPPARPAAYTVIWTQAGFSDV
jgi:hypothetical protein